tara:strand:- start:10 stop:636 length:627 start_codon:yes stop_codon:yes gene_type:complete
MQIKIFNDYLTTEDLEDLTSLNLEQVGSKNIKVYHNKINNDKVLLNTCLNQELLKRLHKNYHEKALLLLKELNPKKVDLYDYSEFHIVETGKSYVFPIHDDNPDKLLSGVIYLKPLNNLGTIFYSDKKGNNKNLVDWKINRAVFFSRSEKKTWHSFQGDQKTNRTVLVYNLMTNRLKEVYKAEGKNYLLGLLRKKINPTLHKYFRFTI